MQDIETCNNLNPKILMNTHSCQKVPITRRKVAEGIAGHFNSTDDMFSKAKANGRGTIRKMSFKW